MFEINRLNEEYLSASAMMKYLDLCHLSSVLLPGWSTGHPVNVQNNACNIHVHCNSYNVQNNTCKYTKQYFVNVQSNICHTQKTIPALAQHSTLFFIIIKIQKLCKEYWFFILAWKFINYHWKVVQSFQFFRVKKIYIIFVLAFFENEFSNHGRTKFNYVGEDINGCWFHLGIIESLKNKANISYVEIFITLGSSFYKYYEVIQINQSTNVKNKLTSMTSMADNAPRLDNF